jgi:hypothetical protein
MTTKCSIGENFGSIKEFNWYLYVSKTICKGDLWMR